MHPLEFMEQAKDKAFRNKLAQNPKETLADMGMDVGDAKVKLVSNTANVVHIPMPTDPNASISDDKLSSVAGGFRIKFGASSLGTVLSTASSADVANLTGKATAKTRVIVKDQHGSVLSDDDVTVKLPKGLKQ